MSNNGRKREKGRNSLRQSVFLKTAAAFGTCSAEVRGRMTLTLTWTSVLWPKQQLTVKYVSISDKWRGMSNKESEQNNCFMYSFCLIFLFFFFSLLPLSFLLSSTAGPCTSFQPCFGRPRGGDVEGRGHFNQLHLPSSEP